MDSRGTSGVGRRNTAIDAQAQSLTVAQMRQYWRFYALMLMRADAEQFLDGDQLEGAVIAHKRVAKMIEYHVALDKREQEAK